MPPVGFQPTISVLERATTVHALERAATVIGRMSLVSVRKRDIRHSVSYLNIIVT
jgi:hypothetical protein